MTRYRFTTDYTSGYGVYATGDVAEFDADTAAWLLRDVAGCIVPVVEVPEPDDADDAGPDTADEPETRDIPAPPADRMVKGSTRRTRGRKDGRP